MNHQDKTKNELIKELQKLQREYDSLKTSYEKDITERKQVAELLRLNEERMRIALQGSPIVIFNQDKELRYTWIYNPDPGFTIEQVIGKTDADLLPAEDAASLTTIKRQVLESGVGTRKEVRTTIDGTTFFYDLTVEPLRNTAGVIVGITCSSMNITERKQTEESLKQALEWQEAIFEGSRDAIFISDQDSRFIEVNSAACDLTGYSSEQLLKMRIPDIHDLPDLDAYKEYHQRILDGEEILSEAKILRSDGAKIDTEFNNRCVSIAGKLYMHTTARNVTERKKTEEEIHIANERLQYLLSSTSAVIYTAKVSGDFGTTFTSSNVVQMVGYDPEDFIRDSSFWHDRVHPEDQVIISDEIKRLFEKGQHTYEYRYKCKDERYIWVRDEMKLVRDNKGNTLEIIGYWTNITDRKSLEEIMKKDRQELKLIIDSSPIIIFYKDKEGKFVRVNKALAEAIKLPEEEFVGKTVFDLYSDKIAQSMTNDDQEIFKSGRPKLNIIEQYESASGTKWVQTDKIPICDENGITFGLIGFAQDITERKRAEEALRLEKENFHHSLDDSPLGVRIVTTKGDTIYANQAILNFYGYDSLGELQKTPLKDRYTPQSYAQAQERKRQRERGDLSATKYEVSIVRKNGEIRHLQVFRKEILWDGISQFQILYDDITERKLAEDEIRKSKKLLEDLHRHLDEIRENERALISREIHDQIGQSLTALKLDLNWMGKYIKNTEPEATAKLQDMIELVTGTIKDVQRISSELRPGILDDLGLAAAIEWYCDEFEKRTGIKCSLKLDDSIFGDPRKNLVFFRVLQEALTNVIRHANASSVTIKLQHTQKGTTLAIQDDGIGMTREKIESAKSLGLIGMRERVKQFGGKIDFSSKEGHGTKLTIFIPEEKKSVL